MSQYPQRSFQATSPVAWFTAVFIGCFPAIAEAGDFNLSATVRGRYEVLDGQVRPGFNAKDDVFSLRTALLAQYEAGNVSFGSELYDSRVYGGELGSAISTNDVNALELVQAYVSAKAGNPFGTDTSAALQVGRFTLNLGSRRLVAADDYRNTTNGYTGLRADLMLRGDVAATLIYTLPQQRRPCPTRHGARGSRRCASRGAARRRRRSTRPR